MKTILLYGLKHMLRHFSTTTENSKKIQYTLGYVDPRRLEDVFLTYDFICTTREMYENSVANSSDFILSLELLKNCKKTISFDNIIKDLTKLDLTSPENMDLFNDKIKHTSILIFHIIRTISFSKEYLDFTYLLKLYTILESNIWNNIPYKILQKYRLMCFYVFDKHLNFRQFYTFLENLEFNEKTRKIIFNKVYLPKFEILNDSLNKTKRFSLKIAVRKRVILSNYLNYLITKQGYINPEITKTADWKAIVDVSYKQKTPVIIMEEEQLRSLIKLIDKNFANNLSKIPYKNNQMIDELTQLVIKYKQTTQNKSEMLNEKTLFFIPQNVENYLTSNIEIMLDKIPENKQLNVILNEKEFLKIWNNTNNARDKFFDNLSSITQMNFIYILLKTAYNINVPFAWRNCFIFLDIAENLSPPEKDHPMKSYLSRIISNLKIICFKIIDKQNLNLIQSLLIITKNLTDYGKPYTYFSYYFKHYINSMIYFKTTDKLNHDELFHILLIFFLYDMRLYFDLKDKLIKTNLNFPEVTEEANFKTGCNNIEKHFQTNQKETCKRLKEFLTEFLANSKETITQNMLENKTITTEKNTQAAVKNTTTNIINNTEIKSEKF